MTDEAVLTQARLTQRILLTGDKDFGELMFRRQLAAAGVVLVRLAGLSAEAKAEMVAAAARDYGAQFSRAFAVLSPGMVRIRAGGPSGSL